MLTCPATIVYETCVDRPERYRDHVLAAKIFEGYHMLRSCLTPRAQSEEVYQTQ